MGDPPHHRLAAEYPADGHGVTCAGASCILAVIFRSLPCQLGDLVGFDFIEFDNVTAGITAVVRRRRIFKVTP